MYDIDDISTVLSNVIPPVFFSGYKKLGDMACHSKNTEKNDVANMRALKYSTQYETTFSLMNNNPDNINVDWDIRESVNTYLGPFLNQVSVVSNFTINSQVRL
jgi:phosphatidylinositol glycan class S